MGAVITEASQDVCYRVVFRRQGGDAWPDLVRSKLRYRITEVAVRVGMDHGRLRACRAEAVRGYRVKADGTLGAPLGRNGCPYDGASDAGGQADVFRRAAVQAARAQRRAWLASLPSGRRAAVLEGRPMTDVERDAERYPGYAGDLRLLRQAGMDQPGDYMAPDD
jgi:hypothetical protein